MCAAIRGTLDFPGKEGDYVGCLRNTRERIMHFQRFSKRPKVHFVKKSEG